MKDEASTSRVRAGIGSYALAWAIGVPGSLPAEPLDVNGCLRRAAELGAKVAQIADNLPLLDLTDAELDGLLELADSLGLDLEVGTRGIGADNLLRYLAIAVRLRSPLLRVVIDSPGDEPEPDEVVRRLAALLPHFERAGVLLAIENHDRFEAQVLADIVRRLESDRVGICLDTVNSLGALEGPDVVLDALGPLTVNLHVKDFRIDRLSHNMGFLVSGTPAGKGMLDIPAVVRRLSREGRLLSAILELWPAPEAGIAETVAKEWAWAQESMPYLRRVVAEQS